MFGADRVGITHNDGRWNYSPIYDPVNSQTYTWEDDFPFKPKTVIVLAFEMDYEAIRTAPSAISAASAFGILWICIGWSWASFAEGEAQSGAMGLVCFGLPGIILLNLTWKRLIAPSKLS